MRTNALRDVSASRRCLLSMNAAGNVELNKESLLCACPIEIYNIRLFALCLLLYVHLFLCNRRHSSLELNIIVIEFYITIRDLCR